MQRGKLIILVAIIGMLLCGCVSHSEIVYQGDKITATTYTFDGNVAMLEELKDNPDGISKNSDGVYAFKHEDSFKTGKMKELRITQRLFTYEDLELDGGHYTVMKNMDILSDKGEKLGALKKGDTIQAIYFVGDLAVVLAGDGYGFINASDIVDSDGKVPPVQPIAAGPQWLEDESGEQVLEVANQQTFILQGKKVKNIVIDASVTAEAYISMDFDTLTVENSGNVYIQDCEGGQIINRGQADIEIGKDAAVEKSIKEVKSNEEK